MRPLRRLVPWTFALLGSTGCTGGVPEGPTLTAAVQADITGVYPDLRNESYSFAVNANVFEGLTALGHDLRPQPALADRWESPDEQTWLFHLRPGARFSDGRLVRAADVVASIRYAMTSHATRMLLAPVENVEAVADDLVRVRTRSPCPVLLAHMAFAFVLPEAGLREDAAAQVGTGAFKVESWLRGRELVLVRNPHFRGPAPAFGRARFVVTPDPEERMRALRRGEADVIDNVPTNQIAVLRGTPGVRVVSRPSLRVLFLAMRVDELPFSKALVREAVDLALDRRELVRRALHGFGMPSAQLVPPTVLGYNADLKVAAPDRERARERLRAAGYPTGFSVRLDGPTNRYTAGPEIMAEVARQLREVGITVELNAKPKEEFFELVDSGQYQLLLYGWSCETIQAGEALDELIHSAPPGTPPNPEFFSDPQIDLLLDSANRSPLVSERSDLLGQALARVAVTRPVLPLLIQNESFAYAASRMEWDPSLDMAFRIGDVYRSKSPAAE